MCGSHAGDGIVDAADDDLSAARSGRRVRAANLPAISPDVQQSGRCLPRATCGHDGHKTEVVRIKVSRRCPAGGVVNNGQGGGQK